MLLPIHSMRQIVFNAIDNSASFLTNVRTHGQRGFLFVSVAGPLFLLHPFAKQFF